MRFLNFLSSTFFHFFLFSKNCFACDFIFSLSEKGGRKKEKLEEMLKWRDYFSAHIRPGVHIELRSNVLRTKWKYLSEEAINLVEKIFQPSAHSVSYFFHHSFYFTGDPWFEIKTFKKWTLEIKIWIFVWEIFGSLYWNNSNWVNLNRVCSNPGPPVFLFY